MADLQRTVSIIFEGEDRVTVKADGITRSFQEIGTEATDASRGIGDANEALERTGQSAASVDRAVTALKALAASLIVKDFIDANVAFEQFEKTITFATGSAEQASRELDYVREVSQRLGVETRATAESYATFSAAVKGTALEGEGARTIFEAFTGQLALLGRSSNEISGAFVQLAQGISKGKFELEDLKSIAERVPGFFGAFSDALGVTTGELFDLISAGQITGDEILTFAEKINQSLADADFDGYNNKLARLRNSIDDTYKAIGDAGAFDLLGDAIQGTGGAVAGAAEGIIGVRELLRALFNEDISFAQFERGLLDAGYQAQLVGELLDKTLNQSLAETERLLRQAAEAAAANADQSEAETQRLLRQADTATASIAEVDAALKALGVDPKKIKDPLQDLVAVFEDLASNPAVKGDQILAGLEATLKRIKDSDDVTEIGAALAQAFDDGKLSADEFALAAGLLGQAASKIKDPLAAAAKETEKTAAETRKAEEAVREYALELEKLASNERIANIEANVSLNIAQLEADTARVQAAFESIDNTINSTGDVISEALGLLGDFDSLSFGAIRLITDQLDQENRRRDEALKLQSKLTEAQIEQIRAQTKALDRGDALIQIDGAGLQPHLEAFMFEILRAIQVRVNQQGLPFLLGV